MRLPPAAYLIFGTVAIGAFLWLHGSPTPPENTQAPTSSSASTKAGLPSTRDELDSLAAALEAERAARAVLAAEVADLREEVARLSGRTRPLDPVAAAPEPPSPPTAPAADPSFDEQALVDAGFGEREVRELRGRMESLELERLYLRDRAVREGWIRTPRFVRELGAIDAKASDLRSELGDERYDWLLFASGQNNRVLVQSVLDGSAASEAGLQPGDAILSYGDARLFEAGALRDATTQGRAGETVEVQVVRGKEVMRVFVPRGPLGVRLTETQMRPTS
jgi:membrane-associated protease RseP (regulator of RpoE activity)